MLSGKESEEFRFRGSFDEGTCPALYCDDFEDDKWYARKKYYNARKNKLLARYPIALKAIAVFFVVALVSFFFFPSFKQSALQRHESKFVFQPNPPKRNIPQFTSKMKTEMAEVVQSPYDTGKKTVKTEEDDSIDEDEYWDEDEFEVPDEDEWDGESAQDLKIKSMKNGNPEYRLPFMSGMNNESHMLGVTTETVDVPINLVLSGRTGVNSEINGYYSMMMEDATKFRPLLNHGRLIWEKTAKHRSDFKYIFFDHGNHFWVINDKLDFETPHPFAFLPDASAIPFQIANRNFSKFDSSHWVIRVPNQSPIVDPYVLIRAASPSGNSPETVHLHLKHIYHHDIERTMDLLEEAGDEEQESNSFDFDLQMPPHGQRKQMYFTHTRRGVYHTFGNMHPLFNHEKIVKDPIEYIESNPHPGATGDGVQFPKVHHSRHPHRGLHHHSHVAQYPTHSDPYKHRKHS